MILNPRTLLLDAVCFSCLLLIGLTGRPRHSGAPVSNRYPALNVTDGSTLAARQAGSQQAIPETIASKAATPK